MPIINIVVVVARGYIVVVAMVRAALTEMRGIFKSPFDDDDESVRI